MRSLLSSQSSPFYVIDLLPLTESFDSLLIFPPVSELSASPRVVHLGCERIKSSTSSTHLFVWALRLSLFDRYLFKYWCVYVFLVMLDKSQARSNFHFDIQLYFFNIVDLLVSWLSYLFWFVIGTICILGKYLIFRKDFVCFPQKSPLGLLGSQCPLCTGHGPDRVVTHTPSTISWVDGVWTPLGLSLHPIQWWIGCELARCSIKDIFTYHYTLKK